MMDTCSSTWLRYFRIEEREAVPETSPDKPSVSASDSLEQACMFFFLQTPRNQKSSSLIVRDEFRESSSRINNRILSEHYPIGQLQLFWILYQILQSISKSQFLIPMDTLPKHEAKIDTNSKSKTKLSNKEENRLSRSNGIDINRNRRRRNSDFNFRSTQGRSFIYSNQLGYKEKHEARTRNWFENSTKSSKRKYKVA